MRWLLGLVGIGLGLWAVSRARAGPVIVTTTTPPVSPRPPTPAELSPPPVATVGVTYQLTPTAEAALVVPTSISHEWRLEAIGEPELLGGRKVAVLRSDEIFAVRTVDLENLERFIVSQDAVETAMEIGEIGL